MTLTKKISWGDKLGIFSALLCILHCLAVPTLLSMGIGFLNNPVIAFLFIFISFVSIYKVTKEKLSDSLSLLLWIAFTGFVICILLEERAAIFEYGMFLFSVAIILGHFYNMRYCLSS